LKRILFQLAFILVWLAGVVAVPAPAGAGASAEVQPAVWSDTASGETTSFLVVMRSQADLSAAKAGAAQPGPAVYAALRRTATASQAGLLAELQARQVPHRAYWIANAILVRGDRSVVAWLAARSDIQYIESDQAFKVPLEVPDPQFTPSLSPQAIETNLSQVNAPLLWQQGFTGQGIVYANADTGVQWDHPALITQYRGWDGSQADHNYSWWDAIHAVDGWTGTDRCGLDLQAPCDDHGHGTHTTGIGVGDDGAGNQVGMAPGAKWIACRNMYNGVGRPSTYIECLQFFIAPTDLNGENPDPAKAPQVISNSYSCPPSEGCTDYHVLQDAIEAVRAAGIFMSVSAGNSGPSCSTVNAPPGLEAGVFTVGAVTGSNTIALFSSRGPVTVDGSGRRKPDLVAPGVSVRSAYPPAGYTFMSGTSMAAPHVAGAVALLWSAVPGLRGQVAETEALFEETATHGLTSEGCGGDTPLTMPNNTYGYGLLNVYQAYISATHPYKYILLLIFKN
jgi:serine protease AprX